MVNLIANKPKRKDEQPAPKPLEKSLIYKDWFEAAEHFTKRGGFFTDFVHSTIKATKGLLTASVEIIDHKISIGLSIAEAFTEAANITRPDRLAYMEKVLTKKGGYDDFSQNVVFQAQEILIAAMADNHIPEADFRKFNSEIVDAIRGGAARTRAKTEAALGS